MPSVTGQRHYCVRCHNRPIPNEIWRGGGPGSRLCEVCDKKAPPSRRRKDGKRQVIDGRGYWVTQPFVYLPPAQQSKEE